MSAKKKSPSKSGGSARKPTKVRVETRGHDEFHSNRNRILDAFKRAEKLSSKRSAPVYHGESAEGALREWLAEFLPKRFGVTSGFLTSQEMIVDAQLRHYDIIIYDQLSSPVLFTEELSDKSELGRSRLIPVEHVHAVIEVKATLTAASAKAAMVKLAELEPFKQPIGANPTAYPLYFPKDFYLGCVFVHLKDLKQLSLKVLNTFASLYQQRGFHEVTILSGKGFGSESTIHSYTRPNDPCVALDPLSQRLWSDSFELKGETHRLSLRGFEGGFAKFAFDLLAIISGTYRQGEVSSMYGYGYTETPSDV